MKKRIGIFVTVVIWAAGIGVFAWRTCGARRQDVKVAVSAAVQPGDHITIDRDFIATEDVSKVEILNLESVLKACTLTDSERQHRLSHREPCDPYEYGPLRLEAVVLGSRDGMTLLKKSSGSACPDYFRDCPQGALYFLPTSALTKALRLQEERRLANERSQSENDARVRQILNESERKH